MFQLCYAYMIICRRLYFNPVAIEAEQNYSEEDGWEFITLADQVTMH